MKVKCIKEPFPKSKSKDYKIYFGDLVYGKIYDVLSIEKDCYCIVDSFDKDYLYPPELFEVVDG